ncbi:MAG TPA: RDD family protein [Verrucomicrobiae bacterium]|jgi:uncharacterized RDD family membrane protein YckC|nr:RDD family protein [Verrucomicrobiae bacterium]
MQAEYKIIGGDGVEYGPATLEELRSWIRDGRVAGLTQVWRSDVAAWSPATRYAELGGELARLHAAAVATAVPCGFWARLAAYLIDCFILAALFQLVWTQSGQARLWTMPILPAELTDASLQQFLKDAQVWFNHAAPYFYPVYFLYDVLLNGRFGATIGKMAIGARIVLLDGSPIGYWRATLRWLAARVSDLFCFAGYLLIVLRADKRALHDLLAGTRVIYKR